MRRSRTRGTRVRPPRIALVTHSVFEEDPRLGRQAQALTAAGMQVDVFALRRPGDAPEGDVDGARVVRVGVTRHQGAGIGTYVREYLAFLLGGGWALVRGHRRRRYDVVSVAAPPDPLVFASLPLRLTGVPVLLDLHEATPEFFRTRFPRASNRVSQAVLRFAERTSIRYADISLSVNDARHRRLLALGMPADRLRVVTNGPVLGRLRPADHPVRPFMADGELRLVYAGGVTPLYDLGLVVRAMARLEHERPDLRIHFDVYGRGDAAEPLAALAEELGLADRVALHGRIPLEAVAAALAAADIGVSPLEANPFTEISLPTKALEYSAMGKPSVVADTIAAREHFRPGDVAWYAPGDDASFATAILRLVDDADFRTAAASAAQARAAELSWDREAPFYVAIIRALANRTPVPPPA